MEPITRPIDTSKAKTLELEKHDDEKMKLDKTGYFLIRIDKGTIELGFCGYDNVMRWKVSGDDPKDLIKTALKQEPVSDPYHAAYLGRELQKAKIALDLGKKYVQDEELTP